MQAIAFPQETRRRMFCVQEGDHLTLLNVYKAFIRVSTSMSHCQPFILYMQSSTVQQEF